MYSTKNCTYYWNDGGQVAMVELPENKSILFNEYFKMYTDMKRIQKPMQEMWYLLQDYSVHLNMKSSEGLDNLSIEEMAIKYNTTEIEYNRLSASISKITSEMGSLFEQMTPQEQAWTKQYLI